MNIYVGNLSHQANEQHLEELFSDFGKVSTIKVIKDNYTGQSRGFAFVEMDERDDAIQAMQGLNETEFMGRTIVVNEAKPKTFSNNRNRDSFSGGGNRRFNRNY